MTVPRNKYHVKDNNDGTKTIMIVDSIGRSASRVFTSEELCDLMADISPPTRKQNGKKKAN